MALKHFKADSLPERLLFDTNFLVDLVVETQQRHQQCGDFFNRIIDSQTQCYCSYLVFAEFVNATARLFLRADLGLSEEQAGAELRASGPLKVKTQVLAATDKLDDLLGYPAEMFLVRLDGDVWRMALDVANAYGLQPYDSIHAATARYTHCADVVSFDWAFDRVQGLSRWTY